MRTSKYSDEQIGEAVKTSSSIMEVMRKIGMKWAGGSHTHLSKRIKQLGLGTSHFCGKSWNKGRRDLTKKPPSEILVVDRLDGRKEKATTLKRCLFDIGRGYFCEICGDPPIWKGNPLTLQIHHKNGNPLDNREENLMLVCPNCHTQTETFGSKNMKKMPSVKKYKYKIVCRQCESLFETNDENGKYCSEKCFHISQRVVEWPSKETLSGLIIENSFVSVGKIYGVSDKTVKKWAKVYGLPIGKNKSCERGGMFTHNP